MDTITLQCFIAVAETGSFTKAASQVSRTQSALSQQISKLENLLGKSLFHRGRQATLTPEGEVFLGYAKQIYALHREALERFKGPQFEGRVRFGLPEDFASSFLSEVLSDFKKIYPKIVLTVECDLTMNLLDRFSKGDFDMVLVKADDTRHFAFGQAVWSEPLVWVGGSGTLRIEHPVPLVLSPEPCVYRARAISRLEHHGLSWQIAFSSPSFALTVAAVKANLGVTVLPRSMVPKELKVLNDDSLPELKQTQISIIKQQKDSPVVNLLESFVLKHQARLHEPA